MEKTSRHPLAFPEFRLFWMALVDYVHCWRTVAGTGEGMGFMYRDAKNQ